MSCYARTLFVYKYLKSTGKLTTAAKKASENTLRHGYQNMMRYKMNDDSFREKNVRLTTLLAILNF